ncbi:MAG TPA: hypothetical protein VFR07_12900 [Mycobacteriales bacterium]|jgi:hypothetical protein|nr:hypothetical protein [Mycobacteriales bacterium]
MTVQGSLLVCDAAQADSDGRLYVLGAGTQVLPLPTPPHALMVRLRLATDDALRPHEVRLALFEGSGSPVMVPGPALAATGPAAVPGAVSAQPLQLGQDLPALAASAEDLPDWGPVAVPLVFNLGPGLPVRVGPHRWTLTVDGTVVDDAVLLFLEQTQEEPAG